MLARLAGTLSVPTDWVVMRYYDKRTDVDLIQQDYDTFAIVGDVSEYTRGRAEAYHNATRRLFWLGLLLWAAILAPKTDGGFPIVASGVLVLIGVVTLIVNRSFIRYQRPTEGDV